MGAQERWQPMRNKTCNEESIVVKRWNESCRSFNDAISAVSGPKKSLHNRKSPKAFEQSPVVKTTA